MSVPSSWAPWPTAPSRLQPESPLKAAPCDPRPGAAPSTWSPEKACFRAGRFLGHDDGARGGGGAFVPAALTAGTASGPSGRIDASIRAEWARATRGGGSDDACDGSWRFSRFRLWRCRCGSWRRIGRGSRSRRRARPCSGKARSASSRVAERSISAGNIDPHMPSDPASNESLIRPPTRDLRSAP
jgi:hypothetical protein